MSDPRTPLRAACVQLNAARPLDDVLATAGALVVRAAASGATLVVLPEKWNAIGPKERMLEAGEDLSGPTVAAMRGWAAQHGIWLVGGSISERLEGALTTIGRRQWWMARANPGRPSMRSLRTRMPFHLAAYDYRIPQVRARMTPNMASSRR